MPEQDASTDLELIETKPVEDDAEARRARRAAILAKYQSRNSSTPQPASEDNATPNFSLKPSRVVSGVASSVATPGPSAPDENNHNHNHNTGVAPSPVPITQDDGQFLLSKEPAACQSSREGQDAGAPIDGGVEGVAAADYDPSKDMRDDVRKAAQLANDTDMADGEEEEEESKYEEENADDIDDMFAIDDDSETKPKKKKKKVVVKVGWLRYRPALQARG